MGRNQHRPEMHKRTSWKQPVRLATTAAGTLATSFEAGDTIDGETLATGDRLLIMDQASAPENGIYVVAATGAPTRAYDMDSSGEFVGSLVYVIEGTANGGRFFRCLNTSDPAIGTDPITFDELASVGVTDHGALTGLADDDHSAYSLNYGGSEEVVDDHGGTGVGSTETIAPANGNWHVLTLDADCTITLTGPTNGTGCSLTVVLVQDGTGGWIVTWPGSVSWGDAGAPTLATDPGDETWVALATSDGGSNWRGFWGGGSVVAALDDLTDVTITTPTTGDGLVYDGSGWVDGPVGRHTHIIGEPATGDNSTTVFYLVNFAEYLSVAAYVSGSRTDITQDATYLDKITFGSAPGAAAPIRFDYVPVTD